MSTGQWVTVGLFIAGALVGIVGYLYKRQWKQVDRSIQNVGDDAAGQVEALKADIAELEAELASVERSARNGRSELHQKLAGLRREVEANTISTSQFEQFERRFNDLRDDVRSLSTKVDNVPEKVATLINRMQD